MWTSMWSRLHTMRTIQVVLDERTLRAADRAAKRVRVNRSALIRAAINHYLRDERARELERRHKSGYERLPVEPGEFDVFDRELVWPKT
jgi:metal-responsive CopG/Arc/MetJ family transcriptional regulator